MTLRYRPEIDGLRCMAVLPVIFYHAGFTWFSGGYVGVDVFFVISGYLITTLILADITQGSFTLLGFYERRARRILPALFLVIICCLPFAWIWLLPAELQDFRRSVTSVVLFASNFLFWSDAGYFGSDVETIPLIHTWSLAVEEQYYLFFPLLLLAVARFGTGIVVSVLATIAVASLLFSGFGSGAYPNLAFYLLPARAWELFLGGLVAIYLSWDSRLVVSKSTQQFLAGLGMCFVVTAVVTLDNLTIFPGWAALLPAIGTILLIIFADPSTVVGRLLQARPFVSIGLISYSAYLWHQPLFAFARIRSLQEPSELLYVALIAITLVIAFLSWRLVELPFRNPDKFSRLQIFKAAIYSGAFLLAISFTLNNRSILPDELPPGYIDMLSTIFEVNPRMGECLSGEDKLIPMIARCKHGDVNNTTIALWGDSHANGLASELGTELLQNGMGLIEHSYNACPPITEILRRGREDDCATFNEEVEQEILQDQSIDIVVLMARWTLYLEGTLFDNGEGGLESGSGLFAVPLNQPDLSRNSAVRKQLIAEIYSRQIEKLIAGGKRVVLVYPIPESGWNVPRFLAREILIGKQRDELLSTDYRIYQRRNDRVIKTFNTIGDHPSLHRIFPDLLFCNKELPGRCLLQDQDGPLYFDDDHLNNRANGALARRIVAELVEQAIAPQQL